MPLVMCVFQVELVQKLGQLVVLYQPQLSALQDACSTANVSALFVELALCVVYPSPEFARIRRSILSTSVRHML